MTKLTFTARCSIQADGQGGLEKGTIVMQPAYSGGLLMLGGWDYPCVVDVATIRAAAPLIPCRVGHGQLDDEVEERSLRRATRAASFCCGVRSS